MSAAAALSIPARLSPAADRRRDPRHPVDLPGTLGRGAERPVIVRDISTLGFQAEHDGLQRPDTYVLLSLPGVGAHAARVVWSAGGRMGAEFVHPLEPRELLQAIDASR